MTFALNILAREIASAIAACAQVVDQSSKIPILKTTRISVAGGIASFLATNTDQTITARRACEGEGVACIDTQALAVKVSSLRPDDIVSMIGDGKFVTITQGRTKWKVPVLLDDFPVSVGAPVKGDAVPVDRRFIDRLVIAKGATQPTAMTNYAGVWLDKGYIVAVDGRQMRVIAGADLPTCVIPPVVVDKAASLFKIDAEVTVSDTAIQFATENLTLKAKLYDYKPSDWQAGIAKFDGMARYGVGVEAEPFLATLRRAGAIGSSGEKTGAFINMQLRFQAGQIEVFTRNSTGEEGSDTLDCEIYEEAFAEVGIHGGMLIAAVDTLEGEIRLRYGGASDPIMLGDDDNLRVIFPRMFS